MKRILSWVLALVMIISLLPAVTVLPVQAEATSATVKLWGTEVTIDSENPAYYWVNNGTDVPKEFTTEADWNYAFHFVNDVPTVSLKGAIYSASKRFLQTTSATFTGTLNLVYEGENKFSLSTSTEGVSFLYFSAGKGSTFNLIGESGAKLTVSGSYYNSSFGAFCLVSENGFFNINGGTINVSRTTGTVGKYPLFKVDKPMETLIENCNLTVKYTKANPTSSCYPAVGLGSTAGLTIRNSQVDITTSAVVGLGVTEAGGSGVTKSGRLTIEGSSSVKVNNTSFTDSTPYAFASAILASEVIVKDSSIVEAICSSYGTALKGGYNTSTKVATEATLNLDDYNDGAYEIYTTKDSKPVDAYSVTNYLKLNPVFAQCPHTHTETVLGYAATCTVAGLSDGEKCSSCGEMVEKQVEIPARNPEVGCVGGAEATCTKAQTCTLCGAVVTNATGHTVVPHYDSTYYQFAVEHNLNRYCWVAPTCTEPGMTAYKTCSKCEKFLSWSVQTGEKSQGYDDIEDVLFRVDPLGHKYAADETSATGHKCAYCESVDHVYTYAQIADNAVNHTATCALTGCKAANVELPHTYGEDNVCTDCGYEKPAEHVCVFDQEVADAKYKASDATCTAPATYYYSCLCEESEADAKHVFSYGEVDKNNHTKLEHFDAKESTCTEYGHEAYDHCSACNYTSDYDNSLPMKDHAFNEKPSTELATEADCKNKATYYVQCDNCTAVSETETVEDGEFGDHNYENGYCKVCNEEQEGAAFVAEVGEKKYLSLQAAIDAAKTGETVTLLKNVDVTAYVRIDKAITLDLGTKSVTRTNEGTGIFVTNVEGTVTIKNGSITASDTAIYVRAANVDLYDCTVINTADAEAVYLQGSGIVNIYRGTYKAEHFAQYTLNIKDEDKDNCTINVYSGKFYNFDPANSASEDPAVNFLADKTQHTKKDGEYYVICEHAGDITLDADAPDCDDDGKTEGKKCSTCGKILVEQKVDPATGIHNYNVFVETVKPDFGTQGYDVYKCETCDKTEKSNFKDALVAVAENAAGKQFETLQAAFDAAVDGSIIKLLTDVTPESYVNVNKAGNITLDMNGKSITRVEGTGIYVNNADTVLTITGNGKINAYQAVYANAGKVIIENGTYHGVADTIYVQNTGKVEIINGTFSVEKTTHTQDDYCILNKLDADRKTASIVVKGGTFVGFNPENNASEGRGTDFTADGYIAIDNGDGTYTVREGKWVAQVGEQKFETLADAIAEGGEIKLLADIKLDAFIKVDGATLTIDLNNYTITRENGTVFYVLNGGKLTAKNGNLVAVADVAIYSAGNGTTKNEITLDDVNISSKHFGVYHNGSYFGADVNISNSTITDTNANGAGVYLSGSENWGADKLNTLTITNSTITGATAVEVKCTDAAITGSTLNATGAEFVKDNNNGACTTGYAFALTNNGTAITKGVLNLSSNTYTGKVGIKVDTAADVINNGEAIEAPADYKWINGVLTKKNYVAQVGEQKFETLQAAIDAANGKTVVLVKDIVLETGVVVANGANVTIEIGRASCRERVCLRV